MIIKLFRYLLDNMTEFQWHCIKFALALVVVVGVPLVVVYHLVVLGICALALFAGLVFFALWRIVD
jgi:hypothetical protein